MKACDWQTKRYVPTAVNVNVAGWESNGVWKLQLVPVDATLCASDVP